MLVIASYPANLASIKTAKQPFQKKVFSRLKPVIASRKSCFIYAVGAKLQNNKQADELTAQQQFDIRLAFQAHEIEEHKYYLSEKRGFDVGIEECVADWVASGHAQRFFEVFAKHQDTIYAACSNDCKNKQCRDACWLSINQVHDLLGDHAT